MKKFFQKKLSLCMVMVLIELLAFTGNTMTAKAEGQIKVTFDFYQVADVRLNDTVIFNSGDSASGNTDSGVNTIILATDPTQNFKTIVINGTDYTNSFTITDIDTGGQTAKWESVPAASSYAIEVTTENNGFHSIVWAYDRSFGEDALVEHGTIEVSKINGSPAGEGFGGANLYYIPTQATVTVVLKPEYGYQIGGVSLNGDAVLAAENETGTFTFEMPDTEIHFRGLFVKKDDIVTNSASAVVSAGAVGNGNAIAQIGNAELVLGSATTNASLPAGASLKEGEEIDTTLNIQSLDISTNQVVSKGDGSYWSERKTDLASEAEISLTVNQSATGYAVFRTHNGTTEEIPSTYNAGTGKLTFGSAQFSTYTLVPLTTAKNDYVIQYGSGNISGGGNRGVSGQAKDGHVHQFEWQLISNPTSETDGLEAYACVICGAYEGSVPLSAYEYACKTAAEKVTSAKQNETIILDMGRWNSYPKWLMETIASRRDLTVKLRFLYQNVQYELEILAGTKIDTECEWYGPLKLLELYGN